MDSSKTLVHVLLNIRILLISALCVTKLCSLFLIVLAGVCHFLKSWSHRNSPPAGYPYRPLPLSRCGLPRNKFTFDRCYAQECGCKKCGMSSVRTRMWGGYITNLHRQFFTELKQERICFFTDALSLIQHGTKSPENDKISMF